MAKIKKLKIQENYLSEPYNYQHYSENTVFTHETSFEHTRDLLLIESFNDYRFDCC